MLSQRAKLTFVPDPINVDHSLIVIIFQRSSLSLRTNVDGYYNHLAIVIIFGLVQGDQSHQVVSTWQ